MESERRLHPLSLLFVLGSGANRWLLPAILVLLAARSFTFDAWLAWLFVPYAVYSLLRYLSFRYRYAPDEVVIRTGFIFKNERHVRFKSIHNIDSLQNPAHRFFGVADVRVETAGGQEPEARFQVLSVGDLEEMRRRVFEEKRRAGKLEAMPTPAESAPQGRALLRLPPRELIVYGIVNNRGFVVVAAATGLAWQLGLSPGGGRTNPYLPLDRIDLKSFLSASFLAIALEILFVLLVSLIVLRVLSIGWAFLKLYDFTLTRAGRDLRTSSGLFTRAFHTIPMHRIQVLVIHESPMHRLFDRVGIRVETAGGGAAEETHVGRHWLAPIIRRTEVRGFLDEVLPEIDLESAVWEKVHPGARRRLLKTGLLLAALFTTIASVNVGWWGLLLLIPMLPLVWVNAMLQAAHLGYALTGSVVLFRSGWIWRHIRAARCNKVQVLRITETPFDRRSGMAGLHVDTAGGGAESSRIRIPYLGKETARRLMDDVGAAAARTAFRW